MSGLWAVLIFQYLNLGSWFKGAQPTPAVVVTGLAGFILPLFDGIGACLVWFLRLPSARAPDWDTRFPRQRDWVGILIGRFVQRLRPEGKGGKKSN